MRLPRLWKGLLAFSLMILTSSVMAQSVTILGRVLDENTKEPLISATIKAGAIGTVTDFEGAFELTIDRKIKVLEVSYIGYETKSVTIEKNAKELLNLTVELSETINLLQTATVTSGRYEKALGEATVSLDVIQVGLIESTNATAVDQAIEKIPGVNFVGGQANIRGGSGFTYGAGSRVLLLVNDLPALQADAGTSNWGDIPIENIEQVEVIKGAASSLYGSAAMNGIINIRTSYARSKPETKISLYGGVYDAPKDRSQKWWNDTRYDAGVLFSHKQKIKKLDLVLGGRYAQQKDVREHSDNKSGRVSLGMRYRVTDRLSLGFNSTYNQSENQSYFYWHNAGENIFQPDTSTLSNSTPKRFFIDPFVSFFDK
ncbi:MAG: TonB-dependent receptor plug domain-containing protein, partial [Bacteroidota bacterium]